MLADTPDVEQLEQDLAQLARHRLGFQHPTALTGLRHLLALAVVEREAGHNADLPEARVLALRPLLQKVIARVRNPTTREALQIYFFLDSERPELRWLSRKVLRAPIRGLQRVRPADASRRAPDRAAVGAGVGNPVSLGVLSGRCDGQLVGVKFQQVMRGRDQSPL